MQPRPRVLMLAPETGFLSRRIIQEAGTLGRLGAAVDIFPAIEPLPDPGPLPAGVRLLGQPAPGAATPGANGGTAAGPNGATAAQRVDGAARWLKSLLKRRARPIHRLADALQYTLTDRAGQLADLGLPEVQRTGPYDVVFAHDIPVLPLGLRLREAWGAPLIVDLHEIFPEQKDVLGSAQAQRYWRRVEAAGLPQADGILAVNEAVDAYVTERYRTTANRAVLHNAVPFVREPGRGARTIHEIYGLAPGTRVAVFAGNLRIHGNLETMVLGFAAARLDGWVLALVGDGPARGELERLVAAQGLGDVVRLGHRTRQDELVGVIASADFGIIPFLPYSRNLEISTPAKLYEYLQARLPILSTPLPLVVPVIEREGVGAVFDGTSVERAAAGIRSFVDGPLAAITPERLDRAARNVSWEHEESALVGVVDAATRGAFALADRLAAAADAPAAAEGSPAVAPG